MGIVGDIRYETRENVVLNTDFFLYQNNKDVDNFPIIEKKKEIIHENQNSNIIPVITVTTYSDNLTS